VWERKGESGRERKEKMCVREWDGSKQGTPIRRLPRLFPGMEALHFIFYFSAKISFHSKKGNTLHIMKDFLTYSDQVYY
jgi:hypothetical protein